MWQLVGPNGGDLQPCRCVATSPTAIEFVTEAGERFALPVEKFLRETGQVAPRVRLSYHGGPTMTQMQHDVAAAVGCTVDEALALMEAGDVGVSVEFLSPAGRPYASPGTLVRANR